VKKGACAQRAQADEFAYRSVSRRLNQQSFFTTAGALIGRHLDREPAPRYAGRTVKRGRRLKPAASQRSAEI